MREAIRNRSRASTLFGAVVVAAGMAACSGSMAPSVVAPTVPTITSLPSTADMLADKIIGNASAPNTIIEYGSFWSANSATFHLQVLPQIKSQLVDTGKASVIFRNLFVTGETGVAVSLARCVGTDRFFDAANKIFSTQSTWLSGTDPDTAVQQVMLGFGMSQTVENQCLANTALLSGLVNIARDAMNGTYTMPDGTQRVGTTLTTGSILGLPAVVVNGVLLDGSSSDAVADLATIQKFIK